MSDHIYSISQLNQVVRLTLEQLGTVWITGEISNFTQPVSGHWYLTLKDENAQVRCAMFRQKNLRVTFRPQNGLQVLVRATVGLYEPRGDYQLIIESMHPAGEGLLQQQFEQLKMTLAAEGLFAQHLKKNIPHFSRAVGIITSQTGAALQDILQVLQRRDPSLAVVIYPTAVQGKEATAESAQMIRLANQRQEVDVLIVGRGGGSLEDLWCFNEEVVARAIFNSQIPIISAVGHETDITISDFVADLRAPTPSAAAELVSRDQQGLIGQLQHQQVRLEMALDLVFQQKQAQLQRLELTLQHLHPKRHLSQQKAQLDRLKMRLQQSMQQTLKQQYGDLHHFQQKLCNAPMIFNIQKQYQFLQQKQAYLRLLLQHQLKHKQTQFVTLRTQLTGLNPQHLLTTQQQLLQQKAQQLNVLIQHQLKLKSAYFSACCTQLNGLSPLNVLSRGYSVAKNEKNEIIHRTSQIKLGEQITTLLQEGKIISQVIKIQ